MSAYYYFAASLPMLQFEGELPISTEDFVNDCQRLLSARDFLCIRKIFFEDEESGKIDI